MVLGGCLEVLLLNERLSFFRSRTQQERELTSMFCTEDWASSRYQKSSIFVLGGRWKRFGTSHLTSMTPLLNN